MLFFILSLCIWYDAIYYIRGKDTVRIKNIFSLFVKDIKHDIAYAALRAVVTYVSNVYNVAYVCLL